MKQTPVAVAFAVACLGIAVFSSMDAVVKGLSLAIGTYNTLLWRSLIGIPLTLVPWMLRRPRWPQHPVLRVHVERGLVSALMAVLFFWGLARTPMAQAIALTFIAPLIAQGLAVVLLKERLGRGAILGSALASAGVVVILSGQALGQMADPYEVSFFQNGVVAVVLACAMPWMAQVPDAIHAPALLGAAALAVVSLFLLSWAYARAEASYLAPVEFTAFIWASLWGYLVFGEHVTLTTIAGAVLIIAGCFVAARSPANLPERDVVP
jgi:S-adenosylmethionine uptake transporter